MKIEQKQTEILMTSEKLKFFFQRLIMDGVIMVILKINVPNMIYSVLSIVTLTK